MDGNMKDSERQATLIAKLDPTAQALLAKAVEPEVLLDIPYDRIKESYCNCMGKGKASMRGEENFCR
ncbi:hypothetical protein ACDT12_12960 [Staphylococcus aureus]